MDVSHCSVSFDVNYLILWQTSLNNPVCRTALHDSNDKGEYFLVLNTVLVHGTLSFLGSIIVLYSEPSQEFAPLMFF